MGGEGVGGVGGALRQSSTAVGTQPSREGWPLKVKFLKVHLSFLIFFGFAHGFRTSNIVTYRSGVEFALSIAVKICIDYLLYFLCIQQRVQF